MSFAETAFLDNERPQHQRYARAAKLSVGWISHLYYWIYPGIMVAFTATLFGCLYSALVHHTLTWLPISLVAVGFALLVGYIAYLGITGSTVVSVIINVIQITCLLAVSIVFIWFRVAHPHISPSVDPATHMAAGPAYDNHDRNLIKHVAIPGVGAAMNIVEMLAVLYIAFSEGTGTTPGNAEKAIIVVVLWIVLGVVWSVTNPNRQHAKQVVAERRAPAAVSG